MAGYLPQMEMLDVAPVLGAYQAGDRMGQQDSERNVLREVGRTAATEGYDAASKVALSRGQVGTGLKLSELSLDRQMAMIDFLGRSAVAADTPEKWSALTGTLSSNFGPGSVKGFESFSSRDSAILLSKSALDALSKQQHMDIERRRLAIAEKAAEEKPQYQTLEDASGNKRLIKIDPYGRAITDVTPSSIGGEPTNPFSTGKMNEAQSKDALYTSRMITSEKVLRDPSVVDAALSLKQRGLGAIPVAGNFMVSEAYQKFDQAQRDFINATLRRESGAVISEPEFENAKKQYFPQPGDTPTRLAQKQRNREEAIRGIGAGAGPSYKPPGELKDLGIASRSQPNPAAAAPAAKQPVKVNSAAERDALPRGTKYIAPDGSERIKQ